MSQFLAQTVPTMQTDYKGIDYGLGRSNIDRETGIRYGVISCNSVMAEAVDEIMTQGEDLAYSEALAAYVSEKRAEWEQENPDADSGEFDDSEASDEFSNCYVSDGGLNDYLYEEDGYKLTGCLSNDIFVLRSPFFTFAQFCSPCVPGAGNLDSPCEDGAKTYCLGHDWFDDGKAPYPVFSVETGEQVEKPDGV